MGKVKIFKVFLMQLFLQNTLSKPCLGQPPLELHIYKGKIVVVICNYSWKTRHGKHIRTRMPRTSILIKQSH